MSPQVGWGPAKTQAFLARDTSTSEVHTTPRGVPTMGPWLLVTTWQVVTLTPTSQPGTMTCRMRLPLPQEDGHPRKQHLSSIPGTQTPPHISSSALVCRPGETVLGSPSLTNTAHLQGKDVLSVPRASYTGPHGALHTLPWSPRPAPVGFPDHC